MQNRIELTIVLLVNVLLVSSVTYHTITLTLIQPFVNRDSAAIEDMSHTVQSWLQTHYGVYTRNTLTDQQVSQSSMDLTNGRFSEPDYIIWTNTTHYFAHNCLTNTDEFVGRDVNHVVQPIIAEDRKIFITSGSYPLSAELQVMFSNVEIEGVFGAPNLYFGGGSGEKSVIYAKDAENVRIANLRVSRSGVDGDGITISDSKNVVVELARALN